MGTAECPGLVATSNRRRRKQLLGRSQRAYRTYGFRHHEFWNHAELVRSHCAFRM